MIIKHGRYIFEELQEVQKGMWAFFFMTVIFRCWLAEQAILQSRGGVFYHLFLPWSFVASLF